MNARNFSKSLLVAALALSCATVSLADPIVCEPEMGISPSGEESSSSGWFERLFESSGKPQPFEGAVTMDGTPTGCQTTSDALSIVGNLRERDSNRVLD